MRIHMLLLLPHPEVEILFSVAILVVLLQRGEMVERREIRHRGIRQLTLTVILRLVGREVKQCVKLKLIKC